MRQGTRTGDVRRRLKTNRLHKKDRPGMRQTGDVRQTVDMRQKETDMRHET